MTIRIEITAETSADILNHLEVLTRQLLGSAATAPTEHVEPVEDEAAEESKKHRGRSRKNTVIEHDPNEGKKEDVPTDRTASGAGTAGGADAVSGEADTGAGSESDVDSGAAEDDAPAEVDAVAEKPKQSMTIDELRSFTINEYLNVVTDSLPTRKELYNALLDEFEVEPDDKGIRAIIRLPAEKIDAFKAAVDAKIAEAVKA